MPFLLFFLCFLERAHTALIRDRKLSSRFLPLSAPSALAGRAPRLSSPFPALPVGPPPTIVSLLLFPGLSGLLPLKTGSCFLVQSNKQNLLLSVFLPPAPFLPHPILRGAPEAQPTFPSTASWPLAVLDPGKGSSSLVQWPVLILTSWWYLMPTVGLSSRTGQGGWAPPTSLVAASGFL